MRSEFFQQMGDSTVESKMEGWLYVIRSNRFGLQYSRKRYFVLKDCCLKIFKILPVNHKEDPVRSATIDSCIRVTDNGRECIHRKVFFIFSLHNASNHNDQLKLGASSPEEAARWIRSLKDVAAKEHPNPMMDFLSCPKRGWPYFRIHTSKRHGCQVSMDWTLSSSIPPEAMVSDVVAPSPWKIFGCQNGLRLFKESKDWDSGTRHWDDHPAIMAVGVVDGTSEAIFQTLMSHGPSRTEWDFCSFRGTVVEHLDGHTDIIHLQLYGDWLPWGMKRRDLLLRRYWRREDDGTYVILYHSVYHQNCQPQKGYIRASLKSGGFVVTPINQGKQSLVKHMLSVDWKFWKLYLRPSSARSITIRMVERVAALREMFKSYSGKFSLEFSSGDVTRDIVLTTSEEDIKEEIQEMKENIPKDEVERPSSQAVSLMEMQDAADEFFDVPEPSDSDNLEDEWSPESSPEHRFQNTCQPMFNSAALVKKLHDLTAHKKGYIDLQDSSQETMLRYGSTLQSDPTRSLPCSWTSGDPSSYLVRAESYLQDNHKVKGTTTLTEMIGADWLRSDKREDDLAGRPGSIVKKHADSGSPEFFFIVNIQVPGATTYNLAFYYMLKTPLEQHPLLQRFVNGDDAFRNSRFKLIPYISKGSWIVKQSVGKKACLIGQALEINYFQGKNYLELDVDVGSSTVARGVVSLVLGYLNNLVIEMAFLIQGNAPDELPECLLGTCRINHLDASKSAQVKP
ncbi:hypothetical protein SAY86_026129 [Trapa natans]|uniref:Protein ENHANCED DISEASE RESISTANCE 2-like n=1 Tax=Trapa natans TaxID=22666 RepID=A0AAN7KD93_TRANT|nr:hypothetical protein SAY86_026129 [Trapa natans]